MCSKTRQQSGKFCQIQMPGGSFAKSKLLMKYFQYGERQQVLEEKEKGCLNCQDGCVARVLEGSVR